MLLHNAPQWLRYKINWYFEPTNEASYYPPSIEPTDKAWYFPTPITPNPTTTPPTTTTTTTTHHHHHPPPPPPTTTTTIHTLHTYTHPVVGVIGISKHTYFIFLRQGTVFNICSYQWTDVLLPVYTAGFCLREGVQPPTDMWQLIDKFVWIETELMWFTYEVRANKAWDDWQAADITISRDTLRCLYDVIEEKEVQYYVKGSLKCPF